MSEQLAKAGGQQEIRKNAVITASSESVDKVTRKVLCRYFGGINDGCDRVPVRETGLLAFSPGMLPAIVGRIIQSAFCQIIYRDVVDRHFRDCSVQQGDILFITFFGHSIHLH
jgi:hypothetical protein